jgi:hypothetical protein
MLIMTTCLVSGCDVIAGVGMIATTRLPSTGAGLGVGEGSLIGNETKTSIAVGLGVGVGVSGMT